MRNTTELEQNALEFLNDLRDGGETNMFGAAPYVSNEFGCDKRESRTLVSLWMANFNEDGNYETVNK